MAGGLVTSRNKETQALTGENDASVHTAHARAQGSTGRGQGGGNKHRTWARRQSVVPWQEHRLWNKINLGAILALTLQSVPHLL